MKVYLAGIKSGEIDPETSLADYSSDHGDDYVSIDDVLAYIAGNLED